MKRSLTLLTLTLLIKTSLTAQYAITNIEGYSPQMGALVGMLDDLKGRVTRQVKDLNQEETDFLLDDKANRMGAIILHLAATELYYQRATFYDSTLAEEEVEWWTALRLGEKAQEDLKGKPISYYLDKWDEVRAETKAILKTKDDEWLLKLRDVGPPNSDYNYFWAWFHVMEHQANHMGQIALIKKRLDDD